MTAEEIVRALAVCQRGSEQAYDLAGEAAKWVAENPEESWREMPAAPVAKVGGS
jgi:hypothetical protein